MKFYAVKKGYSTGIFHTWEECQAAIKGFSCAEYEKFETEKEAIAYLEGKDFWAEIVEKDISDGYLVAFTDGSFDEKLNRYSYGVLLVDKNNNEHFLYGYGDNPKYLSAKNIIGEIFGVINALDWAVSNSYENVKIYYDYEGLYAWVSGKWAPNSNAAKMYVNLYHSKFDELLNVSFEKVKGHSNNKYNDTADRLAKEALRDKKVIPVHGENWFVLPYFKESDFQAVAELIHEEFPDIEIVKEDNNPARLIYRFKMGKYKVAATLYRANNRKLLIQGENSTLFQIMITIINELVEDIHIETVLSSAYRMNVEEDKVDETFNKLCPCFPADYPDNIKRLLKQAIANLFYFVKSDDYSQYTSPAFRALEGHIKYLITSAGGTAKRFFNMFNKNNSGEYVYTGNLIDKSKEPAIVKCYSYYCAERHTAFHYGDILGATDSTRIIETKEEVDEIIKKCITLISE